MASRPVQRATESGMKQRSVRRKRHAEQRGRTDAQLPARPDGHSPCWAGSWPGRWAPGRPGRRCSGRWAAAASARPRWGTSAWSSGLPCASSSSAPGQTRPPRGPRRGSGSAIASSQTQTREPFLLGWGLSSAFSAGPHFWKSSSEYFFDFLPSVTANLKSYSQIPTWISI